MTTAADATSPEAGTGSRLDALGRVVELAEGRLAAGELEPARELLARAAERYALSAEHTLVVLGGATGVGKSSLFNALVGIGLSPVAVRRPTTSEPLACVWEAERLEEARPLLDRLGVDQRKQLCRESPLDLGRRTPGQSLAPRDPLAGLVLVDLPDHDSTRLEHRAVVDRAVEFADLLIWVTDPQKYADASWHDDYLKPLSSHGGVTLVVLNQIDKLPAGAGPECMGDLRRLLDLDGLRDVEVLPVSARTGDGLPQLRARLADLVAGRRAAADRLGADVDRIVVGLGPLLGNVSAAEPAPSPTDTGSIVLGPQPADQVSDADRERALAGLRAAAGVASLADAVAARAVARTLPMVSTPLRAVGRIWRGNQARSTPVVGPDAPAAVPVDRGGLDQVLGQFAGAATQRLPEEWGRAVKTRITGSRREVAEQLDHALSQCELSAVDGASAGAGAARLGHAALLLLAALGLVCGLGGAAGALPGFLGPLGAAALVLGALGSVLVDVRARASARARAIKSGQVAAGTLSVELAAVAQDAMFAPAAQELDRYQRALEAFGTVVR
ncbi:50S ribosome-binding GTPase [Actinospica durhamensis]|uniref:50S ribosome-binding GTPase n=1 Tax=Actinospica durhamensis TaxID=1508375 RepID=A0A941IRM8_9ACTN|nr:GTPase [Actinospica durhamensis]MBR7832436.1 50S ribosome-binding GTPase [Actinospica durhamensis]